MSQQTINVGAAANDGTGDTLRSAFQKANANFAELYGGRLHPGFKSARNYAPQPRWSNAPTLTISTSANTVYYEPVFVFHAVVIDRITLRTGTGNATASNVLLGLYANTASGEPGAKVATINASAVSVGSSANVLVHVIPDGGTLSLDPGVYWLGKVFDAASQMCGTAVEANHAFVFGTTNASSYFAGTSQVLGYTEASATLPSTATPSVASTAIPSCSFRVQ